MKFSQFLETKDLGGASQEEEKDFIAASAYNVNTTKVRRELKSLQRNILRHHTNFAETGKTDWEYSGDLARLAKELNEINAWMSKK